MRELRLVLGSTAIGRTSGTESCFRDNESRRGREVGMTEGVAKVETTLERKGSRK